MARRIVTVTHPDGTKKVIVGQESNKIPVKTREREEERRAKEELINTISHEADHVQDAICDYYDVPLDSEQAAYLIGYLVGKMYYVSRSLFCS